MPKMLWEDHIPQPVLEGYGKDGDPTSHCGLGEHSVLDAVNAIKGSITARYTSIAIAMVYG